MTHAGLSHEHGMFIMKVNFLPKIIDYTLYSPLRGKNQRAFVDCLRADMGKGMNPWANEMKPIIAVLIIDFFKFVDKV